MVRETEVWLPRTVTSSGTLAGPAYSQHNITQYNTIQCNVMQCNVMQCNAMKCKAMQCNAMRCNTIQYTFIVPKSSGNQVQWYYKGVNQYQVDFQN